MKARLFLSLFAGLALLLAMVSCSNTRHFAEGQYLVTQNKISYAGKNPGIETSELHGLVQQRPNKKFLGVIRFKLWAYNRSQKGKKSKFRNWMENTVGERPVILDTSMASTTCKEMEKYLGNVGYFYSGVNYSLAFNENSKKAHIKYMVSPGSPYRIKNINFKIEDPELSFWISKTTKNSLIKKGKIYNVYTLDKERERIARFLNNNGYYDFVKDYIFFEVDSMTGTKEMELYVNIKNKMMPDPDSAGKFIEEKHYRYKIDKVMVYPNYDPSKPNLQVAVHDTVVEEIHQIHKDQPANFYYVLYRGKLRINPKILSQNILIENDEPYNLRDVQETFKRFGYLSIYKYANISFEEPLPKIIPDSGEYKRLNCKVHLQRAPLHQYSIEAEGTNSGGDLGMGGNLTYRNRNIFRNGETLQIKLKGAMEAQRSNSSETESQQKFLFFNTFEWGMEAQISFPRFLIPVKMERFPKYFRPITLVTTGFNYKERPTYDRYIVNFGFGYKWQESTFKTHIVQPFNISSVKVYPTPEFTRELEEINDSRLKNQYTDHLITALQYSFIFNNQDIKKVKDFIYFRSDIETSGNLFYLFNNLLESQKDTAGFYNILGIRYAQYARLEIDFRYYWMVSRTNQVVFRLLTGFGIPYGNSDALPFEKGFYLGGANSMRAWIYRGLGPGGFTDPGTNIDKMGDIVLEANIEYRFPIYSFFKGAVFMDAGNVWLINDNESFSKAEFKFDTFYKQIAMDAGLGFRFDFKFFIFRLDFAMRLRDPSKSEGNRWVADKGIWFWNFGIGYPF
ncbi:MAG: BamA/TamA family outer membrane protein [Bacteroidales bacterium]|nr:BamA/TamA family outer membrane protein [Bacteroidales bacterium]